MRVLTTPSICSHSRGLRDGIFPGAHNTKPPLLDSLSLPGTHARATVLAEPVPEDLSDFASHWTKEAGASEMQQGAPEASKATPLRSPKVGQSYVWKAMLSLRSVLQCRGWGGTSHQVPDSSDKSVGLLGLALRLCVATTQDVSF